ncbi:hypothetical protein ACJ41O_012320 [Fusarium nematophilum]
MWFFSSCLRWDDFNIFGWLIVLPHGIQPPGPPPPISILPSVSFTINIRGTLPSWPRYTIGPDRIPTFPPKPSREPDGECETETAELCATRTSYGVSVSADETSTAATQVLSTCATVYGCNVQDASATKTATSIETATGTPILHVVYPVEGRNESLVGVVETALGDLVEDSSDIYASNTKTLGLNYWKLPLTLDQVDELREVDGVASVMEACGNDAYPCWDPTTELVWQEDAPLHLSYISWPDTDPRMALAGLEDRYYFDDSSGDDVDVWVLDTGASIDHPEFDLIRDRVDWLVPLKDFDGVERTDDSYESLNKNIGNICHGTSMLSLVAGKTLGVVKNIKPHLARLPRRHEDGRIGGPFTSEDFIDTISAVNDRITADADGGVSAVLLLAHMFTRNSFNRLKGDGTKEFLLDVNDNAFDTSLGFELRLFTILQDIMAKGALVVTGAGNEPSLTIDGWPQNYAKSGEQLSLPDLLVVGATSRGDPADINFRTGHGSTDLENNLPHVYAPGYRVTVAEGSTHMWEWEEFRTRQSSGTSDAAALTAGLAVYLLNLARHGELKNNDGTSVPPTIQGIRGYIIDKSWSRGMINIASLWLDRNGIFNGVDLNNRACKWNPNTPSNQRRQEGEETAGAVCEIPLPSSTTTSQSDTTTEAMPTLTGSPGTIVTPSGSSCVETATVTQCIIGSGGKEACDENPSCASWVSTETTSQEPEPDPTSEEPEPEPTETEPPEMPLEVKKIWCEDEDNFPGHGDIQPGFQAAYAERLCESLDFRDTDTLGPDDDPIEHWEYDFGNISYFYSISWIEGCVTEADVQYVQWPVGMDDGPSNNGGVGGYFDAGCLRYRFIGAK